MSNDEYRLALDAIADKHRIAAEKAAQVLQAGVALSADTMARSPLADFVPTHSEDQQTQNETNQ